MENNELTLTTTDQNLGQVNGELDQSKEVGENINNKASDHAGEGGFLLARIIKSFKTRKSNKLSANNTKEGEVVPDEEKVTKSKEEIANDKRSKKTIDKNRRLGRKNHTVRKILLSLGVGLVAYLGYVDYQVTSYSKIPPVLNPNDNKQDVFDKNGNDDIVFDANGDIDLDYVDDQKVDEINENYSNQLLEDVLEMYNSETGGELGIDGIKQTLAFSLMNCDKCEDFNEFDKYRLSILIKDNQDKLYSLNYVTGSDFSLDTSLTASEKYVSFISYLQSCPLESCETLDENTSAVMDMIPNAVFVGHSFFYMSDIGADYYAVPVFVKEEDGTIDGKVYTINATTIDYMDSDEGYDILTLRELKNDLAKQPDERTYTGESFVQSESLQEILKLMGDRFKNPTENELESENTNNESGTENETTENENTLN